MAISTYAELTAAINSWSERAYSATETDNFIALAEAGFNRILGPNYRRTTSATVNTDATGLGTLPSDFITARSLVRDVVGSTPLKQVSWDALIALNPYEIAADATHYAISGSSFQVAPITDDNFILTYDAKLAGLSASNTSNWLLTLAPDAYLFMCLAQQRAYEEDFEAAAGFEQKATSITLEWTGAAQVAQFGNVEMVLPGAPR